MADISPFNGICYDRERIRGIDAVTAPPYDMISPALQQELYERDPYNVVRLILGTTSEADTDADNRYTRAAATLTDWLASGILQRDAAPAIYRYEQEYTHPRGHRLVRTGFIARLRLEELGQGTIHPHEHTLSGPKEDRLRLMLACHANFSQIFTIYDDPAKVADTALAAAVEGARPRWEFVDQAGVRHTLHAVGDPAVHARVAAAMADKVLFIADGHHRYETALTYRKRRRQELGAACPESVDHVMMFFANMATPGLTILPFHRIVTLPDGVDPRKVAGVLGELGSVSRVEPAATPEETIARLQDEMEKAAPGEHRFGVWLQPDFHLVSIRRDGAVGGASAGVDVLDVSILHKVIMEKVIGRTIDPHDITYATWREDVVRKMTLSERSIAFILNPTRMDQVRDLAASGVRMPPKSTNFHPKLVSGLVFNLLG